MPPERRYSYSVASRNALRNLLRLLSFLIGKTPGQDYRGVQNNATHGLLSRSNSFILMPPNDSP